MDGKAGRTILKEKNTSNLENLIKTRDLRKSHLGTEQNISS